MIVEETVQNLVRSQIRSKGGLEEVMMGLWVAAR